MEVAEEQAEAVRAAVAPEVRQQLLDTRLKKHQRQLPALSERKWKRLYLDPSLLNHKRRSSHKFSRKQTWKRTRPRMTPTPPPSLLMSAISQLC